MEFIKYVCRHNGTQAMNLHCEVNIRKSPAKQFSEIAYNKKGDETQHIVSSPREGFIT